MTRLVFLIVALALVSTVTASHFRGVSLSWRRTAQTATTTTIEFRETIIWRVGNCQDMDYSFGDSTVSKTAPSCSNKIGEDNFSTLGLAEVWRSTFSHTYSGTTGTFTVSALGTCCRVSTLENAADKNLDWAVQVDLAVAQSPQLGSPLAEELRTNCPAVTFRPNALPAVSGSITYANRIGTSSGIPTLANCAGSPLTLNPATGSFTWDLSAATGAKAYAHQVQLLQGTVSSVMDFAIEITDGGCCGNSCETDSIPADSECDATCGEGTRTGDETCKSGASSASVFSTGKSAILCFDANTPCPV